MSDYTYDDRKFALDLAVRMFAGGPISPQSLSVLATEFLRFMRPPRRDGEVRITRVGKQYFVATRRDCLAQATHTVQCALVTGDDGPPEQEGCTCGAIPQISGTEYSRRYGVDRPMTLGDL